MNHIISILEELISYYMKRRGVGHTRSLIKGAENVDTVVVTSNHIASGVIFDLSRRKIRSFVQLDNIEKLRIYNIPMALDNSALLEIFHRCRSYAIDKREEVFAARREIDRLMLENNSLKIEKDLLLKRISNINKEMREDEYK